MEKDKFWLEDPSVLLRSFTLIPRREDTIEQKINAITRIVIIVFIILLLAKQKQATLFLVVALTVVCLAYYYQKANGTNSNSASSEHHEECQEERFMAHAGNSGVNKQPKTKPHPRRPYPHAIPEDFVVRNQQDRGYADLENFRQELPRQEEDPRESYLVALRRKAEALEREEEIARLESKLASAELKTVDDRYGQSEIFEPDQRQEQIPVPQRRIYLDVGEEDPDVRETMYTPNDPVRPRFRFGNKKRAHDPRANPKVDPSQLMLNRQALVYSKNKEIYECNKNSMRNCIYN